MKTPRDVSASELIKALRVLDYSVTRQKGSHIRMTTNRDGQNHEVIPNHSPIKVGTLQGILKRIAAHHHLTVDDLITRLDLEHRRMFIQAACPADQRPERILPIHLDGMQHAF